MFLWIRKACFLYSSLSSEIVAGCTT